MIPGIVSWLFDPVHWSGSDGIPARTVEHLWYSGLAMVVACLIAIPAGLAIGHTGRGRFLAVNLAGAARAIPSQRPAKRSALVGGHPAILSSAPDRRRMWGCRTPHIAWAP